MAITIKNSVEVAHIMSNNEVIKMVGGPQVYAPLQETSFAFIPLETHMDTLSTTTNVKIADFGAGSGMIAVFAKKKWPQADVYAYENDHEAIVYIEKNVEYAGLAAGSVNINEMSVADIPAEQKFDVVVSTPPFVPDIVKTIPSIDNPHRNDPQHTVYGGYKGLDAQKIFIESAAAHLNDGGFLVTVGARSQKEDIQNLLIEAGFTNIAYLEDPNHQKNLTVVDAGFFTATK